MDDNEWHRQMMAFQDSYRYLRYCDVLDISFTNGETYEVYVAITPTQRQRGLSEVSYFDLDGMLFCYDTPSYVPFHMKDMKMDLDVAWYDANGNLLKLASYDIDHRGPMFCHLPFSYVLEAPKGTIPTANLKVRNAQES